MHSWGKIKSIDLPNYLANSVFIEIAGWIVLKDPCIGCAFILKLKEIISVVTKEDLEKAL